MSKVKKFETVEIRLDKIIGGGQALGTLPDGRKLFAWGGLPGEKVEVQLTKKKSNYAEGIVISVLEASPERIVPEDPDSYLSTSPWQIMAFEAEQRYKADLIKEAFNLHHIDVANAIEIFTDGREYRYRNKVEFSWYGDSSSGRDTLDLAFFRRGSKGKVIVQDSVLLPEKTVRLAHSIRDCLALSGATARELKTLLIRSNRDGNCVWQLYVKDEDFRHSNTLVRAQLPALGGEIIYSEPRSPASVITKRLASVGTTTLTDTILDVPFRYATEGFFQVNLPVYEQALKDMRAWIDGANQATVDLYSGVGTIGLTIGGPGTTLVEVNEHAVREMKNNIKELAIDATPVLAASEKALDYITPDKTIIVDPPRAGLHTDVVSKFIESRPPRIIYLSCNPVTQARDVQLLEEFYTIRACKGYNFFPRTPHIECLVVLDAK